MPTPIDQEITDEHVTEMLMRDAKATSASASARSLGSLLNKRPAGSIPKPNTRFLRNILRDTDNHNAALLAKEAEESRARLRRLRHSAKPEQQLYSARDRHQPKRRRLDGGDSEPSTSHHHHRTRSASPPAHSHHRKSSRDHGDRHKSSTTRPSRSRSPEPPRHRHSKHHGSHHESRSDKPHHRSRRSPSPPHDTSRRTRDAKHSGSSKKRRYSSVSAASDSDPLDAIIGPAPPPPEPLLRARGRGAHKTTTMDQHFDPNYDPSADVHPEDSRQDLDLDWDSALEALRDRQKWQQQGAERLRAAGFSERDVTKWEKCGERSEEDVIWAKKGEGREWDRGKVVDDDGIVAVKPDWGRLKDG